MVELRVLGPLKLGASDGRNVEPLVRRSKRAALLAFLALATPRGPQRRDKLLALFWSESDELHARNALNQALHVLRSTLGDGAILPGGDGEVGVDPAAVWCDAVAFEDALDAGHPAEALALYRGDLLDGFFISDAPEFDHWVDQERERFRHRASDAAWMLAETRAAEGDAVEAVRWARRSAEFLPADEAVLRRLMAFLHELGDRAAAVRAYEAFAWRLTQEYELNPSAETEALVEAIRTGAPPTAALERAPLRSTSSANVGSAARPPANEVVAAATARANHVGAAASSPPTSVGPPASARRSSRLIAAIVPLRSPLVVAILLVAGLVAGVGIRLGWSEWREPSAASPVRFALEFSGAPPVTSGTIGSMIALSPDGRQLVFLGAGPDGPRLFVRRMDRLEATPIPHTSGASLPFFSPDGEWLGFVVGTSLRKVRLAGGPAITICDIAGSVWGASWGDEDIIVFATPAGLWRAPAAGGEAQMLARADTARGERYRWPELLPGARAAVFTSVDEAGFHLAAVSLETGEVRRLGLEGTSPRFAPPGNLVFATMNGALLVVSFDEHALRRAGAPMPIAADVHVGMAGAAKLAVAGTGALVYVARPADQSLVLVDRAGRAASLPVVPYAVGDARFSPDGARIALTTRPVAGEHSNIWVLDLVANTLRRATIERGNVSPVWSSDGRRIAFATSSHGRQPGFDIRWTASDEALPAEALVAAPALGQLPVAFTPDGGALVFQRRDLRTLGDIWVLTLVGERAIAPYLRGPSDERSVALSPDGRWLAYVSNESGRDEVYVRSFPDPGAPVRVSLGGGSEPRWSSNGRELFHRAPQGMVAAEISMEPTLRVGSHEVLFNDDGYVSYQDGAAYDVHPDGQRFLMIRRGSEPRDMVVVLNGFDGLRTARR